MLNIEKLVELERQNQIPACLLSGFEKRNGFNPIAAARLSKLFMNVGLTGILFGICLLVIDETVMHLNSRYFNQHVDLSVWLELGPIAICGLSLMLIMMEGVGRSQQAEEFFDLTERLSDYLNIPLSELAGKDLKRLAFKRLRKEAQAIKRAQANKSENVTEEIIQGMRRRFKAIHETFFNLNLVERNWAHFFDDELQQSLA